MTDEEISENISKCIPELMAALAERKLKASTASRNTGIHPSKLSRLINGLQEPTLEEAVKIRRYVERLINSALVG